MKSYISGVTLTIRRPDGAVEKVVHRQHAVAGVIPDGAFRAMVEATRKAGRGEIVGQEPNIVYVSLEDERAEMACRLADCSGAFPGSAEWREQRRLEDALAAFDLQHPEVIANVREARAKRTADAVQRGLRMED